MLSSFGVVPLVSSFWSMLLPSAEEESPDWPHWYWTAPATEEDAAVCSQEV